MKELKDLLERIVKSVADDPDGVGIREVSGETMTVFEVKVNPKDLGRVIGRKGRIIQAIKTVVYAAAGKAGKRVRVELIQ